MSKEDDELPAQKSQQISNSKLQAALITLVKTSFGNRAGSYLPCSAYRLRLLLYLTELEWAREKGSAYLGYSYIYAANGPWFEEFDPALHSLVGFEIEEASRPKETTVEYKPGRHFSRKSEKLDPVFEKLLIEVKRRYYFHATSSIKNLVYGTEPMVGAGLGDVLIN